MATTKSKSAAKKPAKVPSATNDAWREEALARMRKLILGAAPGIVEERKWKKPSNGMKGVPVWSSSGIICTGETYKDYVKLTFARGASLPDPKRLFNASLEGGTRRAIDIAEGETVDAVAFKALIKAAVAANESKSAKPARKPLSKSKDGVTLLSGDNPQIPKGLGDAPVQAYIAAIPGWKRNVARRVDELIVRTVPKVGKAVKWNSPFYGNEGDGWFISFHCFAKYVKVTFFRGISLRPVPPGESKHKEVRYLDIREDEPLDEKQFIGWVKQASKLPGEKL